LSFGARRYCDLPGPLGRARRGARIVNGIDSKRSIFGLRPLTDVVDGAFDQPRLDAAILSSSLRPPRGCWQAGSPWVSH